MYSQVTFILFSGYLILFALLLAWASKKAHYVSRSIDNARNYFSNLINGSRDSIYNNMAWNNKKLKLTPQEIPPIISNARTIIDLVMTTYNLTKDNKSDIPPFVEPIARIGDGGYYYKINGAHHISFRGTTTRRDIIVDLDFSQCNYEGMWFNSNIDTNKPKVHNGFYMWWKTHQIDLNNILNKIPIGETITFSGHSMGSALAAYSAMDCAASTFHNVVCIIIASPRIGDEVFMNLFTSLVSNLTVINNERDLVTLLPPPNVPLFLNTYIYDSFPRSKTLLLNFETGELVTNHHLDSYAISLDGVKPDKWRWNRQYSIFA